MTEPYYQDEHVTLYHGDCREVDAWRVATAIVTDPPYGLGDLLHRPGHGEWKKLYFNGAPEWDHEAPAIVATLPDVAEHCIVWGGNYFPLPPRRGWLVWDKIVRSFSSGHCELAWTTLDQPVRAYNYANGQLATEGKNHPTQKPLGLMTWCIGFLPDDVHTIADPFAGSGTTLVAAKRLGRRSIGIELDERYCEIAAKRLSQGVLDFGGAA